MPSDNITSEVVIIDQDGHEMPFSPELLLPPGHATEILRCAAVLGGETRAVDLSPDVMKMLGKRSATKVWLTISASEDVESFDDVARLVGLEPL